MFQIFVLGLAAACLAGGIESSGSHDQGSNSWQPSNAPAFDYSSLGNGHYLAGLGQDHQALSQGHDIGQSFNHDGSGQAFDHGAIAGQSFGHDAGHGYQVSEQGQPKSFDVGHHGAIPSFGGSGHDFSGDSYLQAAHDFGNHGQGSFNAHGDDGHNDGHGQAVAHGDSSGEQSDESNGHHEEGNQHQQQSGPFGHTQAFILHDGGNDYGHGGQDGIHDLGVQGFSGHHFGGQQGHDFGGNLGNAEPFTVGEHTDEQHPVEVPLYKHVTVPVPKTIHVNVPKPILVGIPQPYPVKVPVNKPVAVPVETEISIPIEKVVPYPVVKHVPYPVEKHVPYKVEKTVHVHVPQPYPVKVPIYKTIHHHKDH